MARVSVPCPKRSKWHMLTRKPREVYDRAQCCTGVEVYGSRSVREQKCTAPEELDVELSLPCLHSFLMFALAFSSCNHVYVSALLHTWKVLVMAYHSFHSDLYFWLLNLISIVTTQNCCFDLGSKIHGLPNLLPCKSLERLACCLLGDFPLSSTTGWDSDTGDTY